MGSNQNPNFTNYLIRYECILCGMPKHIWEVILKSNVYICRACTNYEGSRLRYSLETTIYQRRMATEQMAASGSNRPSHQSTFVPHIIPSFGFMTGDNMFRTRGISRSPPPQYRPTDPLIRPAPRVRRVREPPSYLGLRRTSNSMNLQNLVSTSQDTPRPTTENSATSSSNAQVGDEDPDNMLPLDLSLSDRETEQITIEVEPGNLIISTSDPEENE